MPQSLDLSNFPYPNGLKVKIDLDLLRPTTLIEIANCLLRETKEGNSEAAKLHRVVCKFLDVAHGDEFTAALDS